MTLAWVSLAVAVIGAAAGLYFTGRRAGRNGIESQILKDSVDQFVKAEEKKAKQVAAHEKRSEEILTADHSSDDVGRLLSTWPTSKDGGKGPP